MTTQSCTIVTDNVDVVEQLTLDCLQHEDVALLELRLVLSSRLVLCELLKILLRSCDKLASIHSEAPAL